ncbi:MAG TPA: hypothetical protein VKK81_04220 [Candidatus Binatia bacterium]|nr:hypothetical protein [Candidatus Binatia bacterium]
MQRLINDLLVYARAGMQGGELTAVDCETVLRQTLHDLQMAIMENEAEVTHDPLPTVRGNAVQLGRVFQNLIDNALKFRGAAPPRVHISARREGAQ